jgi:hypothetical protein
MKTRPSALPVFRILRHPLLWLLLLEALVFFNLERERLLEPVRSPDAVSYEIPAGAGSLTELLSATRTFGYPMLLRFLGADQDSYALLPELHALAYLAAVAFFWYALRLYFGSGWLAFAASVPLLFSSLLQFTKFIQPDVLAPAIAVLSVSFLLLLTVRPAHAALWIGLTVAVFLTYQTRPAYVFLVALVPLLGPPLRWCRDKTPWLALRKWSLGLFAASLLPLFLFCGLRWQTVGHFGLVSFSGYALIGIPACFLDQSLVDELPPEHRRLATEILEARQKRGWHRPYRLDSPTPFWYRQYVKNQWLISEPLARPMVVEERRLDGSAVRDNDAFFIEEWARHGAPPLSGAISIAVNNRLSTLSWAVIKKRPLLYLKWIYDSFLFGLDQTLVVNTWNHWLPLLTILSLPIAILRLGRRRSPLGDLHQARGATWRRLSGLSLLAASFLLAKLALMVLVSYAQERYLVGGLLFIPTALAAVLFEIWRLILAPLSSQSAETF